jgi:hypothetical protein
MFLIGVDGNLFPSRESAPWSKDFDAETYNCPDYDEMICKSMDLQILARKISIRKYKDIGLRLAVLSWILQFRTHRISTPPAIAQLGVWT